MTTTKITDGVINEGEAGALALLLRAVAPLCSDITQAAALRRGAEAIVANLGGEIPDQAVTNLCGLLDAMFDTGLVVPKCVNETEILEARAVALSPARGMFSPAIVSASAPAEASAMWGSETE